MVVQPNFIVSVNVCLICYKISGLVRDLNPGPRAPEARIIPLDQRAGARNRCLRIIILLTQFFALSVLLAIYVMSPHGCVATFIRIIHTFYLHCTLAMYTR